MDFLREKLVSDLPKRKSKFLFFPRERLVSRKLLVFLRKKEVSGFPEGKGNY